MWDKFKDNLMLYGLIAALFWPEMVAASFIIIVSLATYWR